MWLFPLAAGTIALAFAVLLGRQFSERQRPHQAVWTIALVMYAVASLALFLGVLAGWTSAEYRIYWLLGAVLNVPYLAQGEVYLLVHNRAVANSLMALLFVVTVFAAVSIGAAPLNDAALARDLPAGKAVWGPGSFTLHLAQIYAYPTYAFLLGSALWSAWRMRDARELRDRFYGTLGIAVGAAVVAVEVAVGLAPLHDCRTTSSTYMP